MADVATQVLVSIRYFGAARAAAGVESETLTRGTGHHYRRSGEPLGEQNARLAAVLARCSYLCDGMAVRDTAATVRTGQTIDVLPPFAGG